MARTQKQIADRLRQKLTTREAGTEVVSAIISGFTLFVLVVAGLQTDGAISGCLFTLAGFTVLGFLFKIAGWRSVTLTNDEQDWLKVNYKA